MGRSDRFRNGRADMPNRAQIKETVLGGPALAGYLAGFGMNIAFPLQEGSGSTILNAGTLGATLNGVLDNAPARVLTGPFDGGYDFSGSNHGIHVDDSASKDAIESSATQTFSILFKPRSAGPTSSGHIYAYGNADHRLFFNGSMAPRARISRGTTIANTTASTTLTINVVQWLHMVYTANVIRLLRDSGALAELAYSNQTAGEGTQAASTNALYFGNRLSLTLNTDAEIYFIAYGAVALTDAQLNGLGRMTPGLG